MTLDETDDVTAAQDSYEDEREDKVQDRNLGGPLNPSDIDEARQKEESDLGLAPMKLRDLGTGYDPAAAHAATLERHQVASGEKAEPVLYGKLSQDFVKRHRDEVATVAEQNGIVVGEPYDFGLSFDVFDPQSGAIVTVCRPQRRDVGIPAIHKSAQQVVGEVIGIRNHRLMLARVNA